MKERTAVILDATPENLIEAIPKLVDPVTNQYLFPSDEFFDGINNIHNEGFTGSGQIIGIVDTGIDHTHPLLQNAILESRDFTDEGTTQDLHGHGTLVALIAHYVAPKAKIINAKAFSKDGSARESALTAALEWLPSKYPTVVNLSGGIPTVDPAKLFLSFLRSYLSAKVRTHWFVHLLRRHWFYKCALCRAADRLKRSGTTVCLAVGNERGIITCPGRGKKGALMVVGAITVKNEVPEYSALWPDLVAPEISIAPGTSFSAPFVSGTVALLTESLEVKLPVVGSMTLRRANVFFDTREFQDAIVCYGRALEREPLHGQAAAYTPRMKLAFCYLATGEPLIAVKFFEENTSFFPTFADAHMNLGYAYRQAGLLQDSIDAYMRAITLSPTNAEAYIGLGDTYVRAEALAPALEAFERSRKLNPGDPYSLERLSVINDAIGDLDKAKYYMDQLARIQSNRK